MRLPQPLLRATFLSRPNRFVVWADLDGAAVYCHMPNPGRMHELLLEGAELWLSPRPPDAGVTSHQVVLARHKRTLVCLDSRFPPGLFLEAWRKGLVPEVPSARSRGSRALDDAHTRDSFTVQREVTVGASRLDLAIATPQRRWLIETKSCTLVEGRTARFPDAPTLRGARRLRELVAARGEADPVVAFMIQRHDADVFMPNDATDPAFGEELRRAAKAGVHVVAVLCEVTREGVKPLRRVPVLL
jgi:sugar fermentation stimulation protein A